MMTNVKHKFHRNILWKNKFIYIEKQKGDCVSL